MYREGGVCYVYLCYGLHSLLNIVTNVDGIPHAVLIRAIRPTHGMKEMLARCGKSKSDRSLGSGPGRVAHDGIRAMAPRPPFCVVLAASMRGDPATGTDTVTGGSPCLTR